MTYYHEIEWIKQTSFFLRERSNTYSRILRLLEAVDFKIKFQNSTILSHVNNIHNTSKNTFVKAVLLLYFIILSSYMYYLNMIPGRRYPRQLCAKSIRFLILLETWDFHIERFKMKIFIFKLDDVFNCSILSGLFPLHPAQRLHHVDWFMRIY